MGSKKAFIQIELLVVQAKEAAKLTVCKSNQHQIGLALITYASDNDDRIVSDDRSRGITIWKPKSYPVTVVNSAANFAHLLAGGYLPLPQSEKAVVLS